jgi:hypothetical protein
VKTNTRRKEREREREREKCGRDVRGEERRGEERRAMLPVQQQPFGLRQQIPSREGSGGGPASWPETFTPVSRLILAPCRESFKCQFAEGVGSSTAGSCAHGAPSSVGADVAAYRKRMRMLGMCLLRALLDRGSSTGGTFDCPGSHPDPGQERERAAWPSEWEEWWFCGRGWGCIGASKHFPTMADTKYVSFLSNVLPHPLR